MKTITLPKCRYWTCRESQGNWFYYCQEPVPLSYWEIAREACQDYVRVNQNLFIEQNHFMIWIQTEVLNPSNTFNRNNWINEQIPYSRCCIVKYLFKELTYWKSILICSSSEFTMQLGKKRNLFIDSTIFIEREIRSYAPNISIDHVALI